MPSEILPPGVGFHPSQIHAYDVELSGYNGDRVPAYVARPSGDGAHPGVVLVHGIHGHEEHLKDVARRFAVMGYAVILPALLSRKEKLCVVEEEDMPDFRNWLAERSNVQANGDLEAAKSFLRRSSFVGPRIGVVGFCSGGRVGLVFSCNTDGLDAFVNFYSNGLYQDHRSQPGGPGRHGQGPVLPHARTVRGRGHQSITGRRGQAERGPGQPRQAVRDGQLQGGRPRLLFGYAGELSPGILLHGLGQVPGVAFPVPEAVTAARPALRRRVRAR